jgi:hypothetical protein
MGHKKVIDLGLAWGEFLHNVLPKTAQPGAHIAHHMVRTANNFYAGRVAAIAMPGGKIQLRLNELFDRRLALKVATTGLAERLLELAPDGFAARRYRNGPSRSPKTYVAIAPSDGEFSGR